MYLILDFQKTKVLMWIFLYIALYKADHLIQKKFKPVWLLVGMLSLAIHSLESNILDHQIDQQTV